MLQQRATTASETDGTSTRRDQHGVDSDGRPNAVHPRARTPRPAKRGERLASKASSLEPIGQSSTPRDQVAAQDKARVVAGVASKKDDGNAASCMAPEAGGMHAPDAASEFYKQPL